MRDLCIALWSIRGPISRRAGKPRVGSSVRYGRSRDRLAPVGRSRSGRANRERERVRLPLRAQGGRRVNFARRQQYRRLSHTGEAGLGSVIAGLLGLAVASAGAAGSCSSQPSAWASALGPGFRSRIAVESTPTRSTRCIARSPPFRRRDGGFGTLPWHGRGDINSVAIAPTGRGVRDRPTRESGGPACVARARQRLTPILASGAIVGAPARRSRRRWSRGGDGRGSACHSESSSAS